MVPGRILPRRIRSFHHGCTLAVATSVYRRESSIILLWDCLSGNSVGVALEPHEEALGKSSSQPRHAPSVRRTDIPFLFSPDWVHNGHI